MLRDKLKNEDYFKNRYEKDIIRLKKSLSNYYDEKNQTNEEKIPRIIYLDIVNKELLKFYSGYTLGLSVSQFNEDINYIIQYTLSSWIGTVYESIEKALELAIIFDMRNEEINKLIDLLEKYNYKDKFLDLLANYINPEWKIRSDELQFKKAVGPLVEVVELAATDKTKAVKRLKTYLDKQWFNMQKEGLITNRDHLKKDKYRGYWSIESAALVKMLNLDDEELKECKYYPYDLAHYNRS